jgi:hypothetical protein
MVRVPVHRVAQDRASLLVSVACPCWAGHAWRQACGPLMVVLAGCRLVVTTAGSLSACCTAVAPGQAPVPAALLGG